MSKETNDNKDKKIKIKRISRTKERVVAGTERKKKHKARKICWLVFKVLVFTFIACGVIGVGVVLSVLSGIINDTEAVSADDLKMLSLTTFIYDKDGNEIDTLYNSENRILTDYNDLPDCLKEAVVAIEDERFWTHGGVDIKRTARAILEYVLHSGDSSFGGSTITQQLVKNITDDDGRSWQRKIREWYRAVSLEKTLGKNRILESYLNTIYMGAGAYGVETAAQTYFAKDVKDVDIAEAACLAAIIQAPEAYNPYNGEDNKTALLERQKIVLEKMYELGKISLEEKEEALKKELEFKKGELAASADVTTYFVDAIVEAVVTDLMEAKNVSRGVALQMIYSNGYKIYSTMDSKVQDLVDIAYSDSSLFYVDWTGKMVQSSMIVIENSTGNVVGLSGGAGEKTGLDFNRATQMTRQSGSSIKPITVYAPAFELGKAYPAMGIDDAYFSWNGWAPKNYAHDYSGYVSIRYAIQVSLNIPAAKMLQRVGIDYSYTFAKKMGLTTLTESDKGAAALALGGQTHGVSVIDMASAYATFANGGIYMKPQFYTKVVDADGNIILQAETEYKRVMKETTAFLMTSCLRSVITNGTAYGYAYVKSGIDFAGKTGTTDNDYDRWFCAYSPYYTAAVWTGYDIGAPIRRLLTQPVMKKVMYPLHQDLPSASFKKPSGIVSATVCSVSGLVPTEACQADTRNGIIVTDYFASGTVPTATCNIHVMSDVCSVSSKLATEYCALYDDVSIIQKSFITRTEIPTINTADWSYMLYDGTEQCDIHTEPPEEPDVPDEGDVVTPEFDTITREIEKPRGVYDD